MPALFLWCGPWQGAAMEHDFLIIGGGIAGLSAAAELSALVQGGEAAAAHHAAGRSAALCKPRYGLGQDMSCWPMIFDAGETWSAKPDAGALIVSPADDHPMAPHDAGADDMVLAEGLARYEEMVSEPVTRLIANWAGLRTFAPDRVLVIGRDAVEPAFFWLAGQGGYGFQTSPAASVLVADLLGERRPVVSDALVAALSPARVA